MPEYTLSLLFWIVPIVAISIFFAVRGRLQPIPRKAMIINLGVLTAVGFILDLLFAKRFFTFPNTSMILGPLT